MNIRPVIEGCEGQDIEVKTSLLSGTRLFVNGKKAPKGPGLRTMALTRNDGRVVTAQWKQQMLGFDTPQLDVDGKTYILTQPLKWYEMVLTVLPIALVFIGGLLGAIVGVVASGLSASIFRSGINKLVKILLAILIVFAAVIVFVYLRILFLDMIQ